MTNLVQWDPFTDLRSTMDRMFDQGFSRPWRFLNATESQGSGFPVEIWDTDDAVELKAALPGVRPEDVELTVVSDTVTIKAHHDVEDETPTRSYYRREIPYGSFSRSFTLPASVDADHADARYEYGMLHLRLPKADSVRPKQIKITNGHTDNGHV